MKTYGRCLRTSLSTREHSLPEEFDNACRLCLTKDNVSINIFNEDVVPISLKLRYCIAIEVTEDDGLPRSVCKDCISQLDQAYAFKKRCLGSDIKLRQFIKVPSFSHSFPLDDCSLQETTLSEDSERSRSKDACTIKIEENSLIYPSGLSNINPNDEEDATSNSKDFTASNEIEVNENNILGGNDDDNRLCEPLEILKLENNDAGIVENGSGNEENCEENASSWSNETEEIQLFLESDGSVFLDNNRRSTRIMLTDKKKFLQTARLLKKSTRNESDSEGEEIVLMKGKQLNSSNKSYRCARCKVRYSSYKELLNHIRSNHIETLKMCNVCGKSFISNSTLERHMRTHTGERPFECQFCCKKFSQKEILNRHQLRHSGEKPYKCKLCNFCCYSPESLKYHNRTCHSGCDRNNYPRFKCTKCDKAFYHPSGVSRHQASHIGITFECAACGKGYSDKSSLKRHQIKLHADDVYVDKN